MPAELVTASGRGLDPHLSPEAALWQAPRVAAARGAALGDVEAVLGEQLEAAPSACSANRGSTCCC